MAEVGGGAGAGASSRPWKIAPAAAAGGRAARVRAWEDGGGG